MYVSNRMNANGKDFPDGGAQSERNVRDIETEGDANDRDAMQVDNVVDSSENAVENKMTDCGLELRRSMLNRIAGTDAYFKQQLMTDPDLTFSEKFTIASELLDRKPAMFLERYGKYLVRDDLFYFEPFRGDYFVDFHLHELTRSFSNVANDIKKVKNRRYGIHAVGSHFSC